MNPNLIYCLMGPTASGKSALAVELTKKFPFHIISVDSALVYRDLNIGTAKPSQQELAETPHELINICLPTEIYSAGQFCLDATEAIQKIQAAGKIPLLVGGTMLYFHSLQFGLTELPKADQLLRAKISAHAKQLGWAKLHEQLQQVNPLRASQIHPNDAQRIQRALEIYYLMETKSQSDRQPISPVPANNYVNLMIVPRDREQLKERIRHRFMHMLDAGFLAEVQALKAMPGIQIDLPALRAVGYRQMWQHLAGQIDWQEMCERSIIATNQLAKRQLTWLRRWQTGVCFACEDPKLVFKISDCINEIV